MIQVTATLTIVAENDRQADQVYEAIWNVTRDWPETPVVQINETERKVME